MERGGICSNWQAKVNVCSLTIRTPAAVAHTHAHQDCLSQSVSLAYTLLGTCACSLCFASTSVSLVDQLQLPTDEQLGRCA